MNIKVAAFTVSEKSSNTGYTRVLLFMFIRRKLGGTGIGCLFQFTYCELCDMEKCLKPIFSLKLLAMTLESS